MGNALSDESESLDESPNRKVNGSGNNTSSNAVLPATGDSRQNAGVPKKKNAVLPAENLQAEQNVVHHDCKINVDEPSASSPTPAPIASGASGAFEASGAADVHPSAGSSPAAVAAPTSVRNPTVPEASSSPSLRQPLESRLGYCVDLCTTAKGAEMTTVNASIFEESNNGTKPDQRVLRALVRYLLYSQQPERPVDMSLNEEQFEHRISVLDNLHTPQDVTEFLFSYFATYSSGNDVDAVSCVQALRPEKNLVEHENDPALLKMSLGSQTTFCASLLADHDIACALQELCADTSTRRRPSQVSNKMSKLPAADESMDRQSKESKKNKWMNTWEVNKSKTLTEPTKNQLKTKPQQKSPTKKFSFLSPTKKAR